MTVSRKIAAAAAAMAACLFVWAAAAQAAPRPLDQLYWTEAGNNTVVRGPVDGSSSQQILSGADTPRGIALDPADGYLFFAQVGDNTIQRSVVLENGQVNGNFTLYGPTGVNTPYGVAVDPVAGKIYWANAGDNTIRVAPLNGSGPVSTLYSQADNVNGPRGIAIDPAGGRIFWANSGDSTIRSAPLAGGGTASVVAQSGVGVNDPRGVAFDGTSLYWTNDGADTVQAISLASPGSANTLYDDTQGVDAPIGLAVDPASATMYWANSGQSSSATIVVAPSDTDGSDVSHPIFGSPAVNTPLFVAVAQAPVGTSAPVASGTHELGETFSCSTGGWGADSAGSFVYRAPSRLAYQWTQGGSDISGATQSTYVANSAGSYRCRVTAFNFTGSASQTSNALTISPPTLSTTAMTSAVLGNPIGDSANLTGFSAPTGTITFSAYGPDNAGCSGSPAYTSSAITVAGNGDYASTPAFTPSASGTYRWIASYSGDGSNSAVSGACNDANESTLVQASPTLTTSATASVVIGSPIADSAVLAGGSSPTGQITFRAYGPDDLSCSGTPAYTSSAISVSGNGTYNSTPGFTPSASGTYRWRASYSGDANNAAFTGSCNDANESSLVMASPTLTTSATASVVIGSPIADSAALIAGLSPTGQITFRAYGPDDANCSGSPAFTSNAVPVSGNGTYASAPAFTPSISGTYRWRASYTGDANNTPASGACNAANESSLVQASPTLTTSATGSVVIGDPIGDAAVLAGGSSPTGQITFRVYGPDDADCSGSPAFTSSAVAVSGNGSYDSAPVFTPSASGTYRWRASYSGDTNNAAFSGSCNDANESSLVMAKPTMVTAAKATAVLGSPIGDAATLTGGSSPTGQITFRAYAPNDATCAGAPAFTSSAVAVSSDGTYYSAPAFTPSAAGMYRWRVTYSGDGHNVAVAGSCNDANQSSTVTAPAPVPPVVTKALRFGKTKLNKKTGTATVTVCVGSPGTLVLSGKGVKRVKRAERHASGCVNLPVRLTSQANRRLRHSGHARIKLTIGFTPHGGAATHKSKTVTLRFSRG